MCLGQDKCIDKNSICDAFPDCLNATDETNCTICPALLLQNQFNVTTNLTSLLFKRQSNTFNQSRLVYMTDRNEILYIFKIKNKWLISDIYMQETNYVAILDQDSELPYGENLVWKTENGSKIGSMMCFYNPDKTKKHSSIGNITGVSLNDLYDTSSHKKRDFVEKCIWKGKDCNNEDIFEQYTDMGVCFTFNSKNDMFIEQSGPGYGLTLALNIEQYEYTKNSETGVGVKLLVHDVDDRPLVKEKGISVSPGLYSFISVETTQVENLKPPWGNCGDKDLKYFSGYSSAKCKLQCETDFLQDRCNCRDVSMPNRDGFPQVCKIDQYIKCAKPFLDEMRAAGNYCSCEKPCTSPEHVPTTSFSVLLNKAVDLETNNEPRSINLHKKLSKAREISYRLFDDKYERTLKKFHRLKNSISSTFRFLTVTYTTLEQVNSDLSTTLEAIKKDGMWLRDLIIAGENVLEEGALKIIDDLEDIISSALNEPFIEFRKLMKETLDHYSIIYNRFWDLTCFINGTCKSIDWRGNVTCPTLDFGNVSCNCQNDYYCSRRENAAWVRISSLIDSSNKLFYERILEFNDKFQKLPNIDRLSCIQINLNLLKDTLGSGSVNNCNKNIMKNLKAYVKTKFNLIRPRFNSIEHTLRHMLIRYVKDMRVLDDIVQDKRQYFSLEKSISNNLKSIFDHLNDIRQEILSKSSFIKAVRYHLWFTQLNVNLNPLYKSIKELFDNTLIRIDSCKVEKFNLLNLIRNVERNYVNGSTKLKEVKNLLHFQRHLQLLTIFQQIFDSLIINTNQRIKNLETMINEFYFTFMTVIPIEDLKIASEYFKQKNLLLPKYIIKESPQMAPGDSADQFWNDMRDIFNSIKNNWQIFHTNQDQVRVEVEKYFNNFNDGNDLTATFFNENFLQLELFYKELTERKVSQKRAYESMTLLSDLGGLMGLLLGASVLTLFEVIDLFLYNSIGKCYTSFKSRRVQVWENKA
ncbi:DgyrCDS4630 [Dimorphilus gyrociliatus]|uniref:DgyrCDS4630 n=1 Tax=Dimorphilus gyrociliatus TaxID=2664684 RepID=A0A7I8VI20_9ANNE|nr:DgyrCDS4630 [Dimorphilus gyrociliatus]